MINSIDDSEMFSEEERYKEEHIESHRIFGKTERGDKAQRTFDAISKIIKKISK